MDIDEFRNFFFDLDKTVWNWNELIIGAADAIESVRQSGKNVYFHTDNTLLTRQEYAKKLTSMGIPAEKEDIITSGYVAAKHLEKKNATKVYAIGESGLVEELEAHDIEVSEDASTVVAGFDRQFSYNKLDRAAKILSNEGKLYICSTEKTFRTSKTEKPHQGALNLALEEFGASSLAGKPGEIFRTEFKNYFSYFPEKSLFIGDRLEDVETGNRLGMKTAAVMSGDIGKKALENADKEQVPDYGISSLVKLKRRIL